MTNIFHRLEIHLTEKAFQGNEKKFKKALAYHKKQE